MALEAMHSNEEIGDNDFEKFEDGNYKAVGIDWFSLDDNEQPILVGVNTLVGRLNFKLEGDKEGPPMSLRLGQMPLLLKAFGIEDIETPPHYSKVGQVTQYMEMVENKINQSEKTVSIKVKKGWVNANGVKGMDLPGALYYFELVDITPKKDGAPYSLSGDFNDYFFLEFEVKFGEGGSKTVYEGARFSELVNDTIIVKNGEINFKRTSKGDPTVSSKRLGRFMTLTAPSMFPIKVSDLDNSLNVLSYWLKIALSDKKLIKGARFQDKGRMKLQINTVEWANEPKKKQTIKPEFPETIEDESDAKAKAILLEALEIFAGEKVVTSGYSLNAAGKKIVKKWITPVRKDGLIPQIPFKKLSWDNVKTIFDCWMESLNDLPESFEKLYDKLTQAGIRIDLEDDSFDDEIPF